MRDFSRRMFFERPFKRVSLKLICCQVVTLKRQHNKGKRAYLACAGRNLALL